VNKYAISAFEELSDILLVYNVSVLTPIATDINFEI
jgi:hypothetical protein